MSETTPQDPAAANPQAPRPKKKRRWLRNTIIVVLAFVVAVVGLGTWYAVSIERSVTQNIKRQDSMPAETPTVPGQSARPQKTETETGTLNYVLLGSDSRDPDNENGRSDSLMIVHLNKQRDQAYIISFPRDMWVNIPGYGMNKINAAYSFGGSQLAVTTMESLLNVRMDHLAEVDFEGFIDLTTALGGVTVYNPNAFTSHGTHFAKGDITISGEQALWFVRERYSLPNGDLDRAANQRNVLKAILAKGMSADTITDPTKFMAFVSGVAEHVTVDSGLTDSEIRTTALSLRNLKPANIHLLQAPISGFDMVNGQSIDVVNQAQLEELATALQKDSMAAYVKKYPES